MKRKVQALLASLAIGVLPLAADAATLADGCRQWPAWEGFARRFISPGGRVIDLGSADSRTTSEGQAYGLFFALVADDRESFARILQWTEDNLAGGDLTARLPAWLWGRGADGAWGVLDNNAAADADLWLAYALAEAGRLWQVPRYGALAELLGSRILREETADLPGLGRMLLPGPQGFHPGPGLWRLNPSYLPVQALRRLAGLYPDSAWKRLVPSAVDLIVRSAPRGLAPDWVAYLADGGFRADAETAAVGSYNAIRVYLWAGMLAADDPARPVLLKTLAPMAALTAAQGTPPRETRTRDGSAAGVGPAGFSAALLPFLAAGQHQDALRIQSLRLAATAALERSDNYYDQVLTLFGRGWLEGRYRFGRDGALQLARCAPG